VQTVVVRVFQAGERSVTLDDDRPFFGTRAGNLHVCAISVRQRRRLGIARKRLEPPMKHGQVGHSERRTQAHNTLPKWAPHAPSAPVMPLQYARPNVSSSMNCRIEERVVRASRGAAARPGVAPLLGECRAQPMDARVAAVESQVDAEQVAGVVYEAGCRVVEVRDNVRIPPWIGVGHSCALEIRPRSNVGRVKRPKKTIEDLLGAHDDGQHLARRATLGRIPVLTADVRFEGWTTEDWIRFLRLWKPRPNTNGAPTGAHGGIIVVHEDGRVLKLLHTLQGRLDPATALPSVSETQAQALAPYAGQPQALLQLARTHNASWALAMRFGALDEVMERFGARVRREDDFTSQSLMLVSILREMIVEGAIAFWPQRLRGVPVPTTQVVRRTLDALCADGRAIALGLFEAGDLWTSFVARRRGAAFDVLAGPDELRPILGLLSGDWRRDYRHLARAVEDRYAPLGFGCFAELGTFEALRTDPRPGAWSRAIAVRDVVISPMPAAVGMGLGIDGVRYALRGLFALTERVAPLAALAPMVGAARARIARLAGKDVGALLGFDPLAVLRALLER
jgi:hypothetical protein